MRHKVLAALNILSVGLGVGLYLAIQIANHSANRALAAGVDVVAGKANLEVRGDIPEALFPSLAGLPGVSGCTPVVEGVVTLPDYPGEYLRILGVDMFTNEPFRTFDIGSGERPFELERWLAQPGGVAVSVEFARKHGLKAGDRLRALVNSRRKDLEINFLLDPEAAVTMDHVAAMDIGWAQELFGVQGKLSSVQMIVSNPQEAKLPLPPGLTAAPPAQRSFQVQKMLSAFELNLTALSLVSLFVGMFLIHNTVSASVARRRVEIGILRSLGASRNEVRLLFLGEAFLFGAGGSIVGIAGGVLLSNLLVGSVAKTISSLYVLVSIDRFFVSPAHLLAAAGFGLAASLAAAWHPANEAAATDPVRALSMGIRMEEKAARVNLWVVAGFLSLALACAASWLALKTGPPLLGFVAAFLVLFGFVCFSPLLIRMLGGAAPKEVVLRLAAENFRRSIHRNSPTVAALSAAIALVIGVSIMIFSFRNTVDVWMNRGFAADLFVTPASNETIGLEAFVPPEAISFLEKQPETLAVDTFRELRVPLGGETAPLGVVKGADRRNLPFVGGGRKAKMAKFFGGDYVVVTESFARRWRKGEGDRLSLATPGGPKEFEIAGVYYDYTRDEGLIMIDRKAFERYWKDARVQSLALYLRDRGMAEGLAERFRRRFSAQGEFAVYSNRALKQRAFQVFDQTFAVTYVLRAIAVIVAALGIFLSLTTVITEREREIGVFRAVGGSRRQVGGMIFAEAGFIGVAASVLGLAAGCSLALVLTFVVNKAFFGWTISLQFPWPLLAATPFWIVPASLLAAWVPALRASRIPIAAAVRAE